MSAIPESHRLIPASQIAQMIGLSEASIQNGMRDGKIPCVHVGQKRLMSQYQFVSWIDELEDASGFYPKGKPKAKKKAAPKAETKELPEDVPYAMSPVTTSVLQGTDKAAVDAGKAQATVPPPVDTGVDTDQPF